MPKFQNRSVDVVLDVRSRLEFMLGRLDGAENIPVDRLPQALVDRTEIGRGSRILVYCASGARSAAAAAALKAAGFSNVVDGGGLNQARAQYQNA
ncbi:MAG: rhodanese-like domain-containing protein [Gemmatimonadaceae bacterium]|nr:rhodanese-like domain-containing protein [Gemmatimonadaceae bacterium]